MRSPIVWLSLLSIVLAGCGASTVGTTPPPAATPAFDRAALQQAMDQMASEATIVNATEFALRLDPAGDPAVATAAARRSQDSVATYTALQPTLIALTPPLAEPHISDAARAAARAAYSAGAANAAASAASMTPAPGQPADEAAMMRRATIAAATMIALGSGAPVDPAVATAAVSYYEDTIATISAYQAPSPAPPPAPPTPPAPTVEWQTPTPVPLPDLRDVPLAPAPSHLAEVALPATQEEVAALFAQMPPAVAGEGRDTTTSILVPSLMEIDYGSIPLPDTSQAMPRIILSAGDRSRDPSRPGWSGAQIIAVMAREEIPDRVSGWGRDGHLYWLRSTMAPPDPQRTVPNEMLLIGSDTSAWVFSLLAPSPEELDALAEALAGAL